jgi:allantoicase
LPTGSDAAKPALKLVPAIPTLPLTGAGFSAYGHVIESFARSIPPSAAEDDERSIKAGTRGGIVIKSVNFGTARKFNNLAPVTWVQPGKAVTPVLNQCIFRCDRQVASNEAGVWPIEALERHQYSSQSFVPMGGCQDGRYLVIVALADPGGLFRFSQNSALTACSAMGKPDPATLRSFVATSGQGISYKPNVWHHPLIALREGQTDPMEFICSVYETGDDAIDCELLEFDVALASTIL